MRIAILGAGAIGGYFGARLALAGHDVVFVARGAHLKALQTRGLFVESIIGDLSLDKVTATDDTSGMGAMDLVLVCVKTWQLDEAAEPLAPLVGSRTAVLPLLNGVEAVDRLNRMLGRGVVLGGLAKIIAFIDAPGRIRHVGADPFIGFGAFEPGHDDLVATVRDTLSVEGITVRVSSDIEADLWAKFLFMAAWGGVGAVSRAPVGVLRQLAPTRRLLEQAMTEVFVLGRARGVNLGDDLVARSMAFVDSLPPESTASLQRDIMDGKPSELAAWNGAVVRMAEAAGVDAPVHGFITACLMPAEQQAL